MSKFRYLALLAVAAIAGAPSLISPDYQVAPKDPSQWPATNAGLSVMTYNVKGLPWPAASGRPGALSAIGQRLELMRSRGVQPHVVLLQEAFIDQAKQLGKMGGYPFMATGPQLAPHPKNPPLGQQFAAGAQSLKGETSGTFIDSGLLVLSDYPIVKTERYAFPQGACAGFDCLAAKGILITWIKVPGDAKPLAIVDTHLNSRRPTHVSMARADEAYGWQVRAVRAFLANALDPAAPAIFGGDFNTGQIPKRLSAMSKPVIGARQVDDLSTAYRMSSILPASLREVRYLLVKNKDKMLSRDGSGLALVPKEAWVPFSLHSAEPPMSDHAGFVIDYKIVEKDGKTNSDA